MRRQRDAAFTDEIITNIKQFQTDTDCDKPDEMIVSHAKEKTVNSIVTSQKNVGQFGNNGARGDCDIDDKEKYLKAWKGLKQGTSEFLPDGGAVFGSPFLCLCELIEGRKSWIINCFWQGFGKETIVSNWLLISRREKGGPERKEADTERYPARLPAHLLQQPGEGRNEPEDAAIPHGSLGDRGDDERLHTPGARGSCRGDGQDGASRERKKRAGEDFWGSRTWNSDTANVQGGLSRALRLITLGWWASFSLW